MAIYTDAPCYKCNNRKVGCHSSCEVYKEYNAECEVVRSKRRQNQIIKSKPKQYKSYLSEPATAQHKTQRKKKEKLYNERIDNLRDLRYNITKETCEDWHV